MKFYRYFLTVLSVLFFSLGSTCQNGPVAPKSILSWNQVTPVGVAYNCVYRGSTTGVYTLPALWCSTNIPITAASEVSTTITFISSLNPWVGSSVVVSGMTPSGYNGTFTVVTSSSTQFTVTGTSGLAVATVFGVVTGPTNNYTDLSVVRGTTYHYAVTAFGQTESGYSNDAVAAIPTAPASPVLNTPTETKLNELPLPPVKDKNTPTLAAKVVWYAPYGGEKP